VVGRGFWGWWEGYNCGWQDATAEEEERDNGNEDDDDLGKIFITKKRKK